VARFNQSITEKLLEGSLEAIAYHGGDVDNTDVVWVPGAVELPLVAQHLAASGKYAAIITLGCVIRGATSHYDYVCSESARGVVDVSLETGIPILFGVLTTENRDQAIERTTGSKGNKGFDVTAGAIEMANLMEKLNA
jgi:6,7-dimethyl-8-ribityllumazine synthase